jgi:hypothetical protein
VVSEKGKERQPRLGSEGGSNLQREHQLAGREHTAWVRDVVRWRTEYREALLGLACRVAGELALENYEDALTKHEAAISAHEEILKRHERLLDMGGEGREDLAGEFQSLHRQLETRHERSRQQHEYLRKIHTALLEALAMLAAQN